MAVRDAASGTQGEHVRIPILAAGERISRDVLDYITYAKAKGCNLTGPEDLHTEYLNVLTKE